MDFRAIQVLSQAVSTLMDEIKWDKYGPQELHTPVVTDEKDCHNLDLLLDIMGSLTRMMDTRITFVTTEGKVVKEWIQSILEIAGRYRRELEILESFEKVVNRQLEDKC
jgi:tRNA C32,U32 (ribose-2'-O)-methylase TrmJ